MKEQAEAGDNEQALDIATGSAARSRPSLSYLPQPGHDPVIQHPAGVGGLGRPATCAKADRAFCGHRGSRSLA